MTPDPFFMRGLGLGTTLGCWVGTGAENGDLPSVEQGSRRPQVLQHVRIGSIHDTLFIPSGSSSERGVAPQGQKVTFTGRSGHEGHVPS